MEALTWEALGTIAGAAMAASVFAQIVKAAWPDVSARATRIVMIAVALVCAELVALMSAVTVQSAVVALFVGLSAALAAMKAYETLKHGFSAEVSDESVPVVERIRTYTD